MSLRSPTEYENGWDSLIGGLLEASFRHAGIQVVCAPISLDTRCGMTDPRDLFIVKTLPLHLFS